MDEILNRVATATVDEVVKLEVDITPENRLHKFLQRKRLLPSKRQFELTGIRMGTLVRISRILLQLDVSFFTKENLLQSNYQAIDQHAERLAECIALAIHNKKAEVPKSLVKFILHNFTTKEVYRVLGIVLKQMDITNFMSSIISIKGINILANPVASVTNAKEVSLQPEEIIASGVHLEG